MKTQALDNNNIDNDDTMTDKRRCVVDEEITIASTEDLDVINATPPQRQTAQTCFMENSVGGLMQYPSAAPRDKLRTNKSYVGVVENECLLMT